VVGDADLSTDEHVISDSDGAGESALCGDDGCLTDFDIVADVDLRIEFAPASQACGLQGSGVNRGEGTDFDVVFDDDAGELGHADHLVFGAVGPAEPGSPEDGAGADGHAPADGHGSVDDGAGLDDGSLSDGCPGKEYRAVTDRDVGAEGHTGFDDGVGADRGGLLPGEGSGVEQLSQGEACVGVLPTGEERDAMGKLRGHENGSGELQALEGAGLEDRDEGSVGRVFRDRDVADDRVGARRGAAKVGRQLREGVGGLKKNPGCRGLIEGRHGPPGWKLA
jgi:hypothetical protein